MSHWLDKLERKIGRYAIPNLMNYLIVLYVIGFAVFTVNPLFYVRYLSLDPAMILQDRCGGSSPLLWYLRLQT